MSLSVSRYCTSCGTPLRPDAQFCTLCGVATAPPEDGPSNATVTQAESIAPSHPEAPNPGPRSGRWIAAGVCAATLVSAGVAAALLLHDTTAQTSATEPVRTVTIRKTTTVRSAAPTSDPTHETLVRRTELLGYSAQGRRIVAVELGEPSAPQTILVVGCVHGDECSGTAVVTTLRAMRPPSSVHVWLIPNLNPDGRALGTRGNAHGVDLNRNSPYDWKALGSRGSREYSGTGPLSEPETRILTSFVQRVQPNITFWFHQRATATLPPLIDDSGGRADIESHYATLVQLPFQRKPRYPGSLASWSNRSFPGTTAFVIELSGKRSMTEPEIRRHATAVYAVTKYL